MFNLLLLSLLCRSRLQVVSSGEILKSYDSLCSRNSQVALQWCVIFVNLRYEIGMATNTFSLRHTFC